MRITTLHSMSLISPEVAPQLKPRFHLFQRVRDQLYLTPPTLEEDTSSAGAYLGVLGFSQPLEKLVLHAVALQSLLDWLSQPKGPNLVEASAAAAPDRALVLAVMKRMLYGGDSISGGGAHVQASLHFHGAFQCCLHASACVARCGLQCGVGEQAEFLPPYICHCL